jgi:hypothetical protein
MNRQKIIALLTVIVAALVLGLGIAAFSIEHFLNIALNY